MRSFFASREAQTTLECPNCKEKMFIARTCHEVYMRCKSCGREYPLQNYIAKADEAMEAFLEQVYVDRI